MKQRSSELDMLHGPLAGKLLRFTLPIALSSIVQQLFNAADTAVVGSFGSADALAAVGTNTELIALIVTVSTGLSIGANVLIDNQIGRQETDQTPAAVQKDPLAVPGPLCGLQCSPDLHDRPLPQLLFRPVHAGCRRDRKRGRADPVHSALRAGLQSV